MPAECSWLSLSEPCSFQFGLSQVCEMLLKIGVEEYDKEVFRRKAWAVTSTCKRFWHRPSAEIKDRAGFAHSHFCRRTMWQRSRAEVLLAISREFGKSLEWLLTGGIGPFEIYTESGMSGRESPNLPTAWFYGSRRYWKSETLARKQWVCATTLHLPKAKGNEICNAARRVTAKSYSLFIP